MKFELFPHSISQIFWSVTSAAYSRSFKLFYKATYILRLKGTLYVGEHHPIDNDFIGVVFSFQDSSNFYLLMSARDDRGLVNCQVL